jgi:hypothetical protein
MIASPLGLQMSPVAMIGSRTHSVRCNYREPDMPMIASCNATIMMAGRIASS